MIHTKAQKQEIYKRLSRVGLWYMFDEKVKTVRRDIRAAKNAAGTGNTRHDKDAATQAWTTVWILYAPLCEYLETLWAKSVERDREFVTGYKGDIDELLNPDYNEKDGAMQIRDSMLWVAAEFRRVVQDEPHATTVDFTKAKTKPPTPYAVHFCEEYARHPPGSQRRCELFAKLQQLAPKTKPTICNENEEIGYEGIN